MSEKQLKDLTVLTWMHPILCYCYWCYMAFLCNYFQKEQNMFLHIRKYLKYNWAIIVSILLEEKLHPFYQRGTFNSVISKSS